MIHTHVQQKKMIILQKETTEHRKLRTSAPQGEPGIPPGVLTPQSPCTVERAVGVGTLYQDTIYASAATTNESCRSSHQMMYSPVHTVGGSSLPSGWERILGQGHSCRNGLYTFCQNILSLIILSIFCALIVAPAHVGGWKCP